MQKGCGAEWCVATPCWTGTRKRRNRYDDNRVKYVLRSCFRCFPVLDTENIARRFHQDMTYFTYGLAILANTDHLHLTELELREAFRREFRALTAIYGKPTKLPEFAVKAGVVL